MEITNELAARLPRITVNFFMLLVVAVVWGTISSAVQSLGWTVPGLQIPAGTMVSAVFVVITIYLLIRVMQDVLTVGDLIAMKAVTYLPWIKHDHVPSVRKAIKEIILAFVIIFLSTIVPALAGFIPVVGPIISLILVLAMAFFALALFWDAGQILYVEVDAFTRNWAARVSKWAEVGAPAAAPAKVQRRKKRR